jgi:hypothetical protein
MQIASFGSHTNNPRAQESHSVLHLHLWSRPISQLAQSSVIILQGANGLVVRSRVGRQRPARLSLEYCPPIPTGVVLSERVVGKATAVSNQSRQSADSVQPGQLFEAQHLTRFGHLACWRRAPSAQTIAHLTLVRSATLASIFLARSKSGGT